MPTCIDDEHRRWYRAWSVVFGTFVVLATMACSSKPSFGVWLEDGAGRGVLRFGLGAQRGQRTPTRLRAIRVERCALPQRPTAPRMPPQIMWLASAVDATRAIDSTFVYGLPPQGMASRHQPRFLEEGCYVISVVADADSARSCFQMDNVGHVETLAIGPSGCRRREGERD